MWGMVRPTAPTTDRKSPEAGLVAGKTFHHIRNLFNDKDAYNLAVHQVVEKMKIRVVKIVE